MEQKQNQNQNQNQNQSPNNNNNQTNVNEIETTATKRESENLTTTTATTTKRQRRPSVRLGDIDSNPRRIKQQQQQQWSYNNLASKESNLSGTKTLKSSRNKFYNPILKSCSSSGGRGGGDDDDDEEEERGNFDGVVGSWKVLKDSKFINRKPSKRVKTNWRLNNNNGDGGGGDDEFSRDFDLESSESPLKEHDSPDGLIKHSRDQLEADVELSIPYHKGFNDWKRGKSSVRNVENSVQERRYDNLDNGVRIWLDGLGLGRYAPVFEIHEIDYEVLPLLTFEDLKDMGINSVGSRRKLYCGILKLGQGFS